MPENLREWECCVCYTTTTESKISTVNLRCGHTVCVPCYMSIAHVTDLYHNDYIRCPMCRENVPIRTHPNKATVGVMFRLTKCATELREAINTGYQEPGKAPSQKRLNDCLRMIQTMADDWGLWKTFEEMTHLPSASIPALMMKSTYGKNYPCWCGVGFRLPT